MIGKLITKRLKEDPSIKSHLGDKIFPVMIEKGTELPVLCYNVGLNPSDVTKQGISNRNAIVTVFHFSSSYQESEKILKAVLDSLEQKSLIDDEFVTEKFNLESADSSYEPDTNSFCQKVTFSVSFKSK